MGHTQCGAIEALENYEETKHILSDLSYIYPSFLKLSKSNVNNISNQMIYENIERTIHILKSIPSIYSKLHTNELIIIGMVYNVTTGSLETL